jgi:hypothetical protein
MIQESCLMQYHITKNEKYYILKVPAYIEGQWTAYKRDRVGEATIHREERGGMIVYQVPSKIMAMSLFNLIME